MVRMGISPSPLTRSDAEIFPPNMEASSLPSPHETPNAADSTDTGISGLLGLREEPSQVPKPLGERPVWLSTHLAASLVLRSAPKPWARCSPLSPTPNGGGNGGGPRCQEGLKLLQQVGGAQCWPLAARQRTTPTLHPGSSIPNSASFSTWRLAGPGGSWVVLGLAASGRRGGTPPDMHARMHTHAHTQTGCCARGGGLDAVGA